VRKLALIAAVALALAATLISGATADPTKHFTDSFTIICGGNSWVIVSKPGSSNVLTVNGQDTNSVSILFGLHVVDDQGNVVLDFHKPGKAPVTTCADTSWPAGWTATATTLLTPPHN
jgi:hypothetical protein